jgi:hypothetical protein
LNGKKGSFSSTLNGKLLSAWNQQIEDWMLLHHFSAVAHIGR